MSYPTSQRVWGGSVAGSGPFGHLHRGQAAHHAPIQGGDESGRPGIPGLPNRGLQLAICTKLLPNELQQCFTGLRSGEFGGQLGSIVTPPDAPQGRPW